MKNEFESYEALIMYQFDNDYYDTVTPEKLLLFFGYVYSSDRGIAFYRKKIIGIFKIHHLLISVLPRIIEKAFLEALRKSNDEIEIIKDKIFQSPDSKHLILKREQERFESKFSKLHLADRFNLVDEYSIKNTVFKIILELQTELHTFPYATKHEVKETTDYFSESIVSKIQIKNNLDWIIRMQKDQADEEKPIRENNVHEKDSIPERIKQILEPLYLVIEDKDHVDLMIKAFIKFEDDKKLPSVAQKKAINSISGSFIQPFRALFDQKIFKLTNIATLLTYFIEKNTLNETTYSYNNIYKEISKYKPK